MKKRLLKTLLLLTNGAFAPNQATNEATRETQSTSFRDTESAMTSEIRSPLTRSVAATPTLMQEILAENFPASMATSAPTQPVTEMIQPVTPKIRNSKLLDKKEETEDLDYFIQRGIEKYKARQEKIQEFLEKAGKSSQQDQKTLIPEMIKLFYEGPEMGFQTEVKKFLETVDIIPIIRELYNLHTQQLRYGKISRTGMVEHGELSHIRMYDLIMIHPNLTFKLVATPAPIYYKNLEAKKI